MKFAKRTRVSRALLSHFIETTEAEFLSYWRIEHTLLLTFLFLFSFFILFSFSSLSLIFFFSLILYFLGKTFIFIYYISSFPFIREMLMYTCLVSIRHNCKSVLTGIVKAHIQNWCCAALFYRVHNFNVSSNSTYLFKAMALRDNVNPLDMSKTRMYVDEPLRKTASIKHWR